MKKNIQRAKDLKAIQSIRNSKKKEFRNQINYKPVNSNKKRKNPKWRKVNPSVDNRSEEKKKSLFFKVI